MSKLRNVFIAGVIVNLTSIIFPLVSYRLFSWIFELSPTNIWKWTPNNDISSIPISELLVMFIINSILAFYLAYFYKIIHRSVPGKNIAKGLIYALLLYPIGVLIPMYSLYVLLNIAFLAIVYFAVEGLIEYVLYGIIVGAFIKD